MHCSIFRSFIINARRKAERENLKQKQIRRRKISGHISRYHRLASVRCSMHSTFLIASTFFSSFTKLYFFMNFSSDKIKRGESRGCSRLWVKIEIIKKSNKITSETNFSNSQRNSPRREILWKVHSAAAHTCFPLKIYSRWLEAIWYVWGQKNSFNYVTRDSS